MESQSISRREFLKVAALGLGALSFRPVNRTLGLADFPQSDLLGRACHGTLQVMSRPDPDSQQVGVLYEDGVVPWLKEVIGQKQSFVFTNQRWVEIPDGYVYAPNFQPVRNLPNEPIDKLPDSSLGPGMWVEVTVPYIDVSLENDPSPDSWVESKVKDGLPLRLYYSQIFWVDRIKKTDGGEVLYRVNPNYYGGVDMLWGDARAFRPINAEELRPINPQAENKHILVDATPSRQTLSCYEGDTEVYFCRVSTGAKFDMYGNVVDKWETPAGVHRVARKYISLQMSGGTTGAGYDLPGIGWTSIFATGGVAIHSTFWHNNYGDPMSHGCVNVSPEDAKWIFRWNLPVVPMDPGMVDVTVTGQDSTKITVIAE